MSPHACPPSVRSIHVQARGQVHELVLERTCRELFMPETLLEADQFYPSYMCQRLKGRERDRTLAVRVVTWTALPRDTYSQHAPLGREFLFPSLHFGGIRKKVRYFAGNAFERRGELTGQAQKPGFDANLLRVPLPGFKHPPPP